jgi:hypothetical protein
MYRFFFPISRYNGVYEKNITTEHGKAKALTVVGYTRKKSEQRENLT